VPYSKQKSAEAFVSFIDFAPTVLKLAGLEVPDQMDGRPFLGAGLSKAALESRDETFGHADRFDEKYEMVRSVRIGKWKYIRSYQPYYPDGMQNNYRYKMMAFASWKELFMEDKLDQEEASFFQEKAVERLYNLESDPFETQNLAAGQQVILKRMRKRLHEWLVEKNDLGFLPENILVNRALDNPVNFGKANHGKIERLITISDWATEPWEKVSTDVIHIMINGDELERYWAYMVACSFGKEMEDDFLRVPDWQQEKSPIVQLKAIELIGRMGDKNPMPALTNWLNASSDPVASLIGLNTLVYFRDHSPYGDDFSPDSLELKAQNDEVKRRMAYLNGTW
jgi:hypothetical protein